jgi:hypothetical protein
MILTAEQIRNQNDLKIEIVDVPEWGGEVKIKEMNVRQRGEFELWVKKNENNLVEIRERLLVMVVVDDDGMPLFKESDVSVLQQKNAVPVDRIFEAAIKLNKLSNKSLDDEIKKSQATIPTATV